MTRAMRRMRKYLLIVACIALVAGLAIGGTIAWLSAKTGEVVNTFTVGNIDIKLEEHDYLPETNTLNKAEGVETVQTNDDYKIIPGVDLPKDPFVTVKAGSEACYVFVQIKESENWPTRDNGKISWSADLGEGKWQQLYMYDENGVTATAVEGVYFIEQAAISADSADVVYPVLANDKITVSSNLTKYEVDQIIADLTGADGKVGSFTLNITAYAIQQAKMKNEYVAWQEVSAETVRWYKNTETDKVFSPNSNNTDATNP